MAFYFQFYRKHQVEITVYLVLAIVLFTDVLVMNWPV